MRPIYIDAQERAVSIEAPLEATLGDPVDVIVSVTAAAAVPDNFVVVSELGVLEAELELFAAAEPTLEDALRQGLVAFPAALQRSDCCFVGGRPDGI